MSDLVILIPVRGRPHRVKPLIKSIERSTPDAQVLFLCDPDDPDEVAAILKHSSADFVACGGTWPSKINHGIELTQRPLIFLGADDLEFHPGWFEAARAKLSDEVGIVGVNDLCNPKVIAGEHATHFLVARWYAEQGAIDDPDKLLHEGYRHCFCDNELIGTAKARGAYAHAADAIVEHLHPMVGKADNDATYRQGQRTFGADQKRYRRRRRLWA